jgi:hypothetical protein
MVLEGLRCCCFVSLGARSILYADGYTSIWKQKRGIEMSGLLIAVEGVV